MPLSKAQFGPLQRPDLLGVGGAQLATRMHRLNLGLQAVAGSWAGRPRTTYRQFVESADERICEIDLYLWSQSADLNSLIRLQRTAAV
jgi:hypothetical protein